MTQAVPSPSAAEGAGGLWRAHWGPSLPVTTSAAPRIQCPVVAALVVTLPRSPPQRHLHPSQHQGGQRPRPDLPLGGEPCQVSPRRYTGPRGPQGVSQRASLPGAAGQLQPPGMPLRDAASVRVSPPGPAASTLDLGPVLHSPALPQGHCQDHSEPGLAVAAGACPSNGPAGPREHSAAVRWADSPPRA